MFIADSWSIYYHMNDKNNIYIVIKYLYKYYKINKSQSYVK